jgi:signal transduction histidine kinase/CheY-like chemotaxis protein
MQANLALQTEKAREYESLSLILAQANQELSSTNRALEEEIVERRRAEDRMRFLADQLRETDRRKDEFLATLAHELRNPLAPIRNALGILRHPDHEPADAQRAQEIIDRQIRQMVRLVDDLLDVSRITRDRLELRRQPVQLDQILNAAIETTLPQIQALGHRLDVALPQEPMRIDGDPQRLAQVFGNLLSNACKYTDRGGRIGLAARVDGGKARIAVSDTGIGLQPQQLQSVFELFVQVDTSLERAQGGLGIGLTLVRRLVEMHGGSVEARSDGVGRGSTFEVLLPLAVAEVHSEYVPTTSSEVAQERRRVLVVDDNRDAADTLALALQLLGHDTLTVYDPELVMDEIPKFAPDLAFIDVGMPKLNGFQLVRLIRASPYGDGIYLVALTGWGQEEDRRRSSEAGYDEHLVKPADPGDIERVCRDRRALRVAASTS